METVLFVLFAAGLLVTSGAVVVSRNPLKSALYLIVSLVCLAVLFVLLDAQFVAAMQILVYAGAIMVLFVFVIMLLNLQPGAARPIYVSLSKAAGAVAVLYCSFRIAQGAFEVGMGAKVAPTVASSVKAVGALMYSEHLFALQAIGVLLLVAIVGPIVLGMKKLT